MANIINIQKINVAADATEAGFHMGSSGIYVNGLSLQHPGRAYDEDPNWLLYVNENDGTAGKINIGGTATNDHGGGSVTALHDGTLVFTRGGYFHSIAADLWTSDQPYDISSWTQRLNDYVTASGGCCLSSAVTQNNKYLVVYRNGPNDTSATGQTLLIYDPSTWTMESEVEIAHGETWEGHPLCPCYNWMRFDPRYNYIFVTWSWKENVDTNDNWGSAPFVYSDDNGTTWRKADGTAYSLPIYYSNADIPDDSIANDLYPYNYGPESGITPNGTFYMAVPHRDVRGGTSYLYFYTWNGTNWVPHNLSTLIYSCAFSVGETKDFMVIAYADAEEPNKLKVKISSDDGETWSEPIVVDTLSSSDNIIGVSYCQPIEGYDDNYARFFYAYYNPNTESMEQCDVKWIKFEIEEAKLYFGMTGNMVFKKF